MQQARDKDIPQIGPFLKWAGGKRWFVAKCDELFPKDYANYIEPFLGSGAVFFHLSPSRGVLGDKNAELIATYRAIQKDWRGVWDRLRQHQHKHSYEYYYALRAQRPRTPATAAARFIYLNRTCFNGLYRVNRQGVFNVPKGTKDAVVYAEDDFERVSRLLRRATLHAADFADLIDMAGEDDFIFADPPYTVKHNSNNFLKYNEIIFSWADQIRLAAALKKARARGAKILLCNADHRSIRDLYCNFERLFPIARHSVLAADSTYRRRTTELVVTNISEAEL